MSRLLRLLTLCSVVLLRAQARVTSDLSVCIVGNSENEERVLAVASMWSHRFLCRLNLLR